MAQLRGAAGVANIGKVAMKKIYPASTEFNATRIELHPDWTEFNPVRTEFNPVRTELNPVRTELVEVITHI